MKEENSAAAVVYNENSFLLLKYEMGHWGFVKGIIEEEESMEETILRELKEETGIENAEIIYNFKEDYEYYYKLGGTLIHKRVDCFLIEAKTQNVELSFEHTDYAWLPYQKAMEKLSHENTRDILTKARSFLKSRLNHYMK